MMRHQNSGRCPRCQEIIDMFPGFHAGLRGWFEELQTNIPEAHVSCAGRGRADQQSAYMYGTSRARFGESAHNYNCALDIFVQRDGLDIYDHGWFQNTLEPMLADWIEWYGRPGARFPELPHVELKDWRTYAMQVVE